MTVLEKEISFSCMAKGIMGSEGPLATRDGKIFLVEPREGAIREMLPDSGTRLLAVTGGIPAGMQLHCDGSLWVADMRLGILRVTLDGAVEDVVTHFEGKPIRGCNDCSFDSAGNLYFTAPAGSSSDQPCGEIFCRLSDGTVLRLDQGFAFCNGIAVSADDTTLIVAETFTKRLYGYRLDGPGKVVGKFLFATLPGDHHGGPDGIDFDATGRLIATNWGGGHLEVFSLDGTLEERVPLPFGQPSNLHFAGPTSRTLLVTEHTFNGLWQCEWHCPGQRQYGWQEISDPHETIH